MSKYLAATRISLRCSTALIATSIFMVSGLTATAEDDRGLTYSIGAFVTAGTSPFEKEGSDLEVEALPWFEITGEHFSLGIDGLTVPITQFSNINIKGRLAPRWIAFDPEDYAGLKGFDRDIAIEAGFAADMELGPVTLTLEALRDISDTHGGTEVSAKAAGGLPLSERTFLGIEAGLTWMDTDLATYKYGVLNSDSGAYAAYDIDEVVVPTLGVQLVHQLTDHISIMGAVSGDFLPQTVTDSPIIQRDTIFSSMVGLKYEF